jgi:hypothetical protein
VKCWGNNELGQLHAAPDEVRAQECMPPVDVSAMSESGVAAWAESAPGGDEDSSDERANLHGTTNTSTIPTPVVLPAPDMMAV